jgi:hypothetical protein
MSVFVWVMVGVALWQFAVLVPDRFYGGIIGAFLVAAGGGLLSGLVRPVPGIPPDNPPGVAQALWATPGSLAGLSGSYAYGAWRERASR